MLNKLSFDVACDQGGRLGETCVHCFVLLLAVTFSCWLCCSPRYNVSGFIDKNKDPIYQDFKRLLYNRWPSSFFCFFYSQS